MKATTLICVSLAIITIATACSDTNSTANGSGVCQCNAGYYGTSTDVNEAGSCQQCPSGTNSVLATGPTTISACTCNDTNAVLNSANTACQCQANYYGTPTNSGASGCNACPTGASSSAGSTVLSSCTCSDINSSLNSENTACQCNPNYYGTPTTSGASGCTQCPNGTTSTAGTTDIGSCSCSDTNASLDSSSPPVCQCNTNFYGTPTTSGASGCTPCPTGQAAPAGSTSNVCAVSTTSSNYILPIIQLLLCLVVII
ncbi:hypothetical protein ABPG72_008890 [Tetrahymena utriculariae]